MSTSKQRAASRTPAGAADQSGPDSQRRQQALLPPETAATGSNPVAGKLPEDVGFRQLHDLVTHALDDMKARDVHEIDVRGRSDVADMLVIASGTSSRHVRSIAEEVVSQGKQAGHPPVGVEGEAEGEWVLVDMGDIVVHVMQPRTREFYGLERLWDVGAEPSSESAAAH